MASAGSPANDVKPAAGGQKRELQKSLGAATHGCQELCRFLFSLPQASGGLSLMRKFFRFGGNQNIPMEFCLGSAAGRNARFAVGASLTRISHRLFTAARDKAVSTSLRLALRAPATTFLSRAPQRNSMRNARQLTPLPP